jgi:circadian clock protein KaiC
MSHSNQIREFLLSEQGIRLVDVYLGPAGMLTGSARVALEAQERGAAAERTNENELRLAQLERKRKAMEAQIEALRAAFEAEAAETRREIELQSAREKMVQDDRVSMARSRRVRGRAKK